MAKTYEDYVAALTKFVKADSEIIDSTSDYTDYDIALEAALSEYNESFPNRISYDITSTGVREYALPDTWVKGISESGYKVEYPIDDTRNEPIFLVPAMSQIYLRPTAESGLSGQVLRFTVSMSSDMMPATGESFRLHFDTPCLLTEDGVTVPDTDFFSVLNLAASKLCRMLVPRYSALSDAIAQSGSVNYGNKGSAFEKMANSYYEIYRTSMFGDTNQATTVCVFGEMEDDYYHDDMHGLYPRRESGKKITDI